MRSRQVTKTAVGMVVLLYVALVMLGEMEVRTALFLAWPFALVGLLLVIKLQFIDRQPEEEA